MAENKNSVKLIVERYRAQLETMNVRCQDILLYGSYSRGDEHEGSDIDLIVVSEDWSRYSYRERLELLGVAAARILEPIQAVGFTPHEIFSGDLLPFWREIINNTAKAA